MNRLIEFSLAQQVIQIASQSTTIKNYSIYDVEDKKILKRDTFTGFDIIKEIMESGLSPVAVVEYKEKVATVIEHIFENAYDSEVKNYFISVLTKNDVSKLTQKAVQNLYDYSNNDIGLLETLFKLGFDFKQGSFNEVEKALDGDLSFFEFCLTNKPDFKFSFLYKGGLNNERMFLDEILKEDIDYCKNNNIAINNYLSKKRENLFVFLKKTRESEELRNKLQTELVNRSISIPRNKI